MSHREPSCLAASPGAAGPSLPLAARGEPRLSWGHVKAKHKPHAEAWGDAPWLICPPPRPPGPPAFADSKHRQPFTSFSRFPLPTRSGSQRIRGSECSCGTRDPRLTGWV